MRVSVTVTGGLRATIEMVITGDPDDCDVSVTGDAAEVVEAILSDAVTFGHGHYSPARGATLVERRSAFWVLGELDRARRFGEGVEVVTIVDAKDMPTYELPLGAVG